MILLLSGCKKWTKHRNLFRRPLSFYGQISVKKESFTIVKFVTLTRVADVFQEENKEIALGTSKLNYLDPRISVAWCKKWDVPIEKIYNKTQRDKFAWAIEMADEDFQF